MTKKTAQANAQRSSSKLDTPGGRSYMENLRRLAPTELTQKAIRQVEAEDAARRQKTG